MKKFDQINVIPFIDIMLVLLAIVLMTASFISQGKIKVSVPETRTAEKLTNHDLRGYYITVTKDGIYYLNDKQVSRDVLAQMMPTWQAKQPVTLNIDAKAAFDHFAQITDMLKRHGMDNIHVVTQTRHNDQQEQ